ncbi:hypothetical protein [Shewanella sp. GXUN23E]
MSNKVPANKTQSDSTKPKRSGNSHHIRQRIEDILIAREQNKKLEL